MLQRRHIRWIGNQRCRDGGTSLDFFLSLCPRTLEYLGLDGSGG
jgi:hypothetical protein